MAESTRRAGTPTNTSSVRAHDDSSEERTSLRKDEDKPKPLAERTFEDHFGETAELQDHRVFDKTVLVEREGVTVMTDSPREGDLPLGIAQEIKAQEQVEDQKKETRRSNG
jgi:hypothetical protein